MMMRSRNPSWLVNGQAVRTLNLEDRGLNYGDGLFETIAVRRGQLRLLNLHVARLQRGLTRLQYPLIDLDQLADEAGRLAAEHERAVVKVVVTRGSGPRGYAPPEDCTPTRILGLSPAAEPDPSSYRDGVSIRWCETPVSQNPLLAGLKTLGRLDSVMAHAELAGTGAREGLMCSIDRRLVCGTMSNIFLVRGRTLVTPELTSAGVAGVMRELVLQQARQLKLDVEVRQVDRDSVAEFDEIFLSNSQFGIWPVSRIADRELSVHAVTRDLMAALAECGIEECASR